MSIMISLWIAGVSITLLWIMARKKKSLNMPGPPGLPVVGNMFQLDEKRIHKQLSEWAKTYGDIYELRPTGSPVVVVTGPKQIHQILVKKGKEFSGRHRNTIFNVQCYNGKDVFMADPTAMWHRQKKMMSQTLRGYGEGLKKLEAITYKEATTMLDGLKTTDLVNIKQTITDLTYNIIHIVAVGKTLHDEKDTQRLKELVKSDMELADRGIGIEGMIIDALPWILYLKPPLYKDMLAWMKKLEDLYAMWKREALDEIKNLNEDDSFNLICNLLRYKDGDNTVGLDDEAIMLTVYSMYAAGILTTSISFTCFANIMTHHPDIQGRIYAEIQKVVGNRPVSVEDRTKMPYTQAVMWELFRYSSIVPMLAPHRAITDVEIDGYKIPKDTEVWVNSWGLHHDERLWVDPFKFDPQRYLDDEGKLVLADHPNRMNIIPFGAGPRVCVAESFALNRIFLIIVMFLQRFELLPATTIEDQPSCDPRDMKEGFLMESLDYRVRLKERQQM